jgi:hypothetical protein
MRHIQRRAQGLTDGDLEVRAKHSTTVASTSQARHPGAKVPPADHGIHSLKVVKGTEYTSELCLFNRRSGDLDSKAAGFMRAAADTNMTTIIVRLMMI